MIRFSRIARWQIVAVFTMVMAGTIVMSQTLPAPWVQLNQGASSNLYDASWAVDLEVCHAYPARLMSEHPLYPQLVRFEAEISRFSSMSPKRWERQWHWGAPPDTHLVLVAPQSPGFDGTAYDNYVAEWSQAHTERLREPRGDLAPDLQARLRWTERLLRTDLEEKLQAARYAQELELSRKQAELVRRYQEALMNADLMPRRSAEETGDRPSQRQQIMARIQAQMAEEAQAAQRLLDEYEARMRQQAQLAFSEAQQQAWETMQKRLQSSVSSGSKIADRLSKRLESLEFADETARSVALQSVAAGVLADSPAPEIADLSTPYGAAGRRLAGVLSVHKEKLSRRIYDETVLAVRKSAMEAGTVVVIPPNQAVAGPDMTEQIRPHLRRMWQP